MIYYDEFDVWDDAKIAVLYELLANIDLIADISDE